MGCVSSKHVRKEIRQDMLLNNGGAVNHVVSLTSSTYGVLKLDKEEQQQKQEEGKEEKEVTVKEIVTETEKRAQRSPPRGEAEIINAWELMEGLEEEETIPISNQPKKSPKSRVLLRGFVDREAKSPLKLFNQFASPRKARRAGGKENYKVRVSGPVKSEFSPKSILKVNNNYQESSCKKSLNMSSGIDSSRRRSFSPPFDPELVASYERKLSEEQEQIKRIISPSFGTRISSETILQSFKHKCPPGGENAVVIYTTTLRGIRKTFEECNKVRSILESHQMRVFERDISMDSGLREELRGLMETKQVKVPLVFVKGRLIGGVDEVMKLEEEGKLEILFEGLPRVVGGCEGCGDVRFVMCIECNGSCKVLDEGRKKMVRCGECNENGLMQCPICC